MNAFDLIRITAEADPQDPYLTPIIGLLGTVIVAALTTLGVVYRRRQDAQDKRADLEASKGLTDKEEMTEIDRARLQVLRYFDLYLAMKIAFETVQSALRHLVRSIRENHPEHEFDQEVVDALALKSPSAPADEK